MPVPLAIELRNVSRAYGDIAAVDDVTHSFHRGSFTAIVGRSGCGKSTLLNLCGAMDRPTVGEVVLMGEATSALADTAITLLRRRQVGFVFQFFNLLPTLTVEENVELPLRLDHRLDRAAREHVRELLEAVELWERRGSYPHQLSGGQMQRVAIARALAHRPAVLIADEPTGNLDSTTARTVLKLMSDLSRTRNTTVILATHSDEAAAAADTRIAMRDGRLC